MAKRRVAASSSAGEIVCWKAVELERPENEEIRADTAGGSCDAFLWPSKKMAICWLDDVYVSACGQAYEKPDICYNVQGVVDQTWYPMR